MLEVVGMHEILKFVGEICEKFYCVGARAVLFFGKNVG